MPDLTLDQVREAVRFAWHMDPGDDFDGGMFADGVFVWANADTGNPPHSYDPPEYWTWHHLAGCDCEFCRPDENHT